MKSKLSCGNDVHFIFSSIFASLLITIVISSAISVSFTNASLPNATSNMNMDASIINSNITNTLHHIDLAKAALKNGDTEGAQKHLDLARQNMVTGICQLWQTLNQELLPIGPGSSPMSNLSKVENLFKQNLDSNPLHTIEPVTPPHQPYSPKGPIKQPTSPASNLSKAYK